MPRWRRPPFAFLARGLQLRAPPEVEVELEANDGVGDDGGRARLRELAARFNPDASWVELGLRLRAVYRDARWRTWGYDSFRAYCVDDLGLEKTAAYLLRAIAFLERHRPELVRIPSDGTLDVTVGYNDVVLLARAEGERRLRRARRGRLRRRVEPLPVAR